MQADLAMVLHEFQKMLSIHEVQVAWRCRLSRSFDHRLSLSHRPPHRSFARADLHCWHQTLAQRKVSRLIHEKSGPGVMQRKGGKLLIQQAANARGNPRKNLPTSQFEDSNVVTSVNNCSRLVS
jgi:hypothetical protein